MIVKLAAALVALLPAVAGASELITNGSFESGFTGWSPTSGVAVASGHDYVVGAGGSGSAAAQANHFAAFGGGNVAGFDGLLQSFGTVAGKVYTLGFDYGAFGSGTEELTVIVTGAFSTHLHPVGTTNLDALFTHYSTTFIGDGAVRSINFAVNAGTGDSIDPLVDNVSITGATVPEPAKWALLVAGFGLVGVAARRRTAVAA